MLLMNDVSEPSSNSVVAEFITRALPLLVSKYVTPSNFNTNPSTITVPDPEVEVLTSARKIFKIGLILFDRKVQLAKCITGKMPLPRT